MVETEQVRHTPGPWRLCPPDSKGDQLIVTTPKRGSRYVGLVKLPGAVMQLPRLEAERVANARLMAAAPDMLAALQQIVASYPPGYNSEICQIAAAAIARATLPPEGE